jgi:hypothetical protein
MIAKPPQKEAKILWHCVCELESRLKERAKKQMVEEMKKEMQEMHDKWFKTFLSHITHTKP